MRILLLLLLTALCQPTISQTAHISNNDRSARRSEVHINAYKELPLGAIAPKGWLREMLVRQKTGATGHLDELYPSVMGERNGWKGGDGDQWERGPYWLDGLLPLAYILKDDTLIAKTKPWIEWTLNSQQPDGYFGPAKDYEPEEGLQRSPSRDWWPKMVMLKVLKQYYSATKDERVIPFMTRYFHYQLRELPKNPLDHWSFWAKYRGGDNLKIVYWLYNITKDSLLLDLGELIHKQTFDYTQAFLDRNLLAQTGSIHCVNLAQGLKEPLIYYQFHPEKKYLDASRIGLKDLMYFNGTPNGVFCGDENLHGNNPTQGTEFCTVVEMMYSLESMLEITGQTSLADHLEKIAFNALPAQATDDFLNRQYFQQANQVMVTNKMRNFHTNHSGTDLCYGLLTGYPCCTSNMHQGWPKFTQNLWYATPDQGIAALVYSPSEVTATVAGGIALSISEQTQYPFEESIRFRLTIDSEASVTFPFHLRIPAWCKNASIKINGQLFKDSLPAGQIIKIKRAWKSSDEVTLLLPMHLSQSRWHENSVAIERGPLTYALKIGEQATLIQNPNPAGSYGGKEFYEIRPTTPWNYALIANDQKTLDEQYVVEKRQQSFTYPWNLKNAPIIIKTKARQVPSWQLYNEMAGPLPYSFTYGLETGDEAEITLIPYGCTQLRISEFPITY